MSLNYPEIWQYPLGDTADVNELPETAEGTSGKASKRNLFPAITQVPLKAGGVAPARNDFNALFKFVGETIYFLQHGGKFVYSDTQDYYKDVICWYNNTLYLCIADNGPSFSVGAHAPTDAKYWKVGIADQLAPYAENDTLVARIFDKLNGTSVTPSGTLTPEQIKTALTSILSNMGAAAYLSKNNVFNKSQTCTASLPTKDYDNILVTHAQATKIAEDVFNQDLSAKYVTLTTAQTISGAKTFTGATAVPTVAATVSNTSAASTANVDAKITAQAVKLTGNQTIAGVKTFSSTPKAPTPASSSSDTSVATTANVDAKITAQCVKLTGAQNIYGQKNFGSNMTMYANSAQIDIRIGNSDGKRYGMLRATNSNGTDTSNSVKTIALQGVNDADTGTVFPSYIGCQVNADNTGYCKMSANISEILGSDSVKIGYEAGNTGIAIYKKNNETVANISTQNVWITNPPTNANNNSAATCSWVRSRMSELLPAGTILPFAGNSVPSGFLLCNGSAVSRTSYSALFSAIGTAWGSGDGSSTFNIPDARDRFLEGANSSGVGTYLSAGLPNITGNFGDNERYLGANKDTATSTMYGNGVFNIGNSSTDGRGCTSWGGGTGFKNLNFSAQSSNSTYGNSGTVQPNALNVKFIIKY